MRFEILADSENEFRKRYRSITSSSMMVELSTFGAAIQNIALRDERGWRSIVLSYPSEDALANESILDMQGITEAVSRYYYAHGDSFEGIFVPPEYQKQFERLAQEAIAYYDN